MKHLLTALSFTALISNPLLALNSFTDSVSSGRLGYFLPAAKHSTLPGAYLEEKEDNYLYAWGVHYVCHNGIIEKNTNRVPSDKEIDDALSFFSSRNLPFMWWSSAKVLEEKGLQFGGVLTGMALDISESLPPKPAPLSSLRITPVTTLQDLEIFGALACSAFGLDTRASQEWLIVSSCVEEKNALSLFIAYLEEIPVGVIALSTEGAAAGIWSLATTPEVRRQGVGSALVHAAIEEAKDRGYSEVMAILMPKGMAWGLFSEIGFQPTCEFPFYIHGISAEHLEK